MPLRANLQTRFRATGLISAILNSITTTAGRRVCVCVYVRVRRETYDGMR